MEEKKETEDRKLPHEKQFWIDGKKIWDAGTLVIDLEKQPEEHTDDKK